MERRSYTRPSVQRYRLTDLRDNTDRLAKPWSVRLAKKHPATRTIASEYDLYGLYVDPRLQPKPSA